MIMVLTVMMTMMMKLSITIAMIRIMCVYSERDDKMVTNKNVVTAAVLTAVRARSIQVKKKRKFNYSNPASIVLTNYISNNKPIVKVSNCGIPLFMSWFW